MTVAHSAAVAAAAAVAPAAAAATAAAEEVLTFYRPIAIAKWWALSEQGAIPTSGIYAGNVMYVTNPQGSKQDLSLGPSKSYKLK